MNPLNVFTPASEIKTIDRFAGRVNELQQAADALDIEGGHIVIYGNRGVGKTSLARQVQSLSQGDKGVIERLQRKPAAEPEFLAIYIQCDDSISTTNDLILRLLSDSEALADWIPYRIKSRTTSNDVSGGLKLSVIDLGAKKSSLAIEELPEIEFDLVALFINSLRHIRKAEIARSGVLFIIDEFDRIKDRSGFASILKAVATEQTKFCLVGVASDPTSLILEHESVARQLTGGCIFVPPMSDAEINEIFDLAEAGLSGSVRFTKEAREWIAEAAKGHPFLVHLIGRYSLAQAMSIRWSSISVDTARSALTEIATKSAAPIQESKYKTAIGNSYRREYILKELSKESDDEIHTLDVYARCATALGVEPNAISVYVGHLVSEKFGSVLEKTRERYYRFQDSLFKAYVSARPFQLARSARDDSE